MDAAKDDGKLELTMEQHLWLLLREAGESDETARSRERIMVETITMMMMIVK